MKFTVLALTIGLLIASPLMAEEQQEKQSPAAPTVSEPDLAGVYVCDGVNPEGNPYRGVVEVTKMGDIYHLRWTFPQSDDAALGIGIASNGVLAVSYYGSATAGVVVYKVGDGKKMEGKWTVAGADNQVYKEVLSRLPNHPRPQSEPSKPARPKKPTRQANSSVTSI